MGNAQLLDGDPRGWTFSLRGRRAAAARLCQFSTARTTVVLAAELAAEASAQGLETVGERRVKKTD